MTVLCSNSYRYLWSLAGYDIKHIHFYNHEGEVFVTERGYIQPLHDKEVPTSYDDNDRFSLRVSGDYIQLRNKVRYDRNEHFYIRVKGTFETEIELYLYVGDDSDLQVELINTIKKKHDISRSNNLILTYNIYRLTSKYIPQPVYLSACVGSKTTTTKVGKQVAEINSVLEAHRELGIDAYRLESLLKYFDVLPKKK